MQDFLGKVALICGGTTGIGLATARQFVERGARVVVAARQAERGESVVRDLQQLGGEVAFSACDVGQPESVARLVAFVIGRFGQLDCAVNSASTDLKPAATHAIEGPDLQALMATDLLGVFHGMQYQIEAMLEGGAGGTIVNVSSVNGLSGAPMAAMYSAAKHAVVGLTRSSSREYIARGIRINAVCPGATDTPRRERRLASLSADDRGLQERSVAQQIPIGRLARAEEIASAILWLSSPARDRVAVSISEWWLEPFTKGPGAHSHDEDDVFHVIGGTMSVLVADRWIDAERGAFVLIPGGVVHDFENRGAVPAGILNVSVPGPFEPHMAGIADWFKANPPGRAGD